MKDKRVVCAIPFLLDALAARYSLDNRFLEAEIDISRAIDKEVGETVVLPTTDWNEKETYCFGLISAMITKSSNDRT